MNKHLLIMSLVAGVIGISAIGFWIAMSIPTPEERDAAQKASDISEYMTGIKKIRYVVIEYDTPPIKRMLNSPSDMDLATLNTALREAKWKYLHWPIGALPELAIDEYIEFIYEEGESRKLVILTDKYWMALDQSQERHPIEIEGELLKEFLSILRSRAKLESNGQ